MLSAVAIIPSAPVLVPELAGAAAQELTDLRQAAFAAASMLPQRWLAIGVGSSDSVLRADAAGTFAGYGVDLAVGLSPGATIAADLPLCALITAWVRSQVRPDASAEVHVFARNAADGRRRGAQLRSTVDRDDGPVGVLVVADGTTTLTPAAPGGHVPGSIADQASLDDALAAGDVGALVDLPSSISGRAAWQALAGLAGAPPRSAKELYRGAPYGVGYFVGVWAP